MTSTAAPRVLLISQWPSVKNAEYELVERIRQTNFTVTVVDFLGFEVSTGSCLNTADLRDHFDFAISFHYDTPKFLNLPTFLWVANPLEFIHAQGNYRTQLIHHLRSYDDYLYNGSDLLKSHIRSVVGSEWVDGGLAFFQSCSTTALVPPRLPDGRDSGSRKLFYCGVNWEAISDRTGRSQGLLEILQERALAEFYGPRSVLGVDVWAGFTSYRGEIPFDGVSMFPVMHRYAAVLALSSPAHLKSQTSSGRVMEGFTAGVPVITDDNPHVRSQFGDLPYYFAGNDDMARADSIQRALDEIRSKPRESVDRVLAAQARIRRDYSFEVCLESARRGAHARITACAESIGRRTQDESRALTVDIFLFHHDPYVPGPGIGSRFDNAPSILRAAQELAHTGARVRLVCVAAADDDGIATSCAGSMIEVVQIGTDTSVTADWHSLRLGEKLARMAGLSSAQFVAFFSQFDHPQYDFFLMALQWFSYSIDNDRPGVHLGGFFANDLSGPAPASAAGILRSSASIGLYRWTQDSIAEHQLGQFVLNRSAVGRIDLKRLSRFDVLLPLALVLEAKTKSIAIHRSRHVLLRVKYGHYHRYYDAFSQSTGKGIWSQHYDLLSNASHEINALYDVFHESSDLVAIVDRVSGLEMPRSTGVDPAVHQVNAFIERLRPYVKGAKRVARFMGLRKQAR